MVKYRTLGVLIWVPNQAEERGGELTRRQHSVRSKATARKKTLVV